MRYFSEKITFHGSSTIHFDLDVQGLQYLLTHLSLDYFVLSGHFMQRFIIENSVELVQSINPRTKKIFISKITFFGDYSGDFNGVKIGDTIFDLIEKRINIVYERGKIQLKEHPYIVTFDVKEICDDNLLLNTMKDYVITKISIEKYC